MNLKAIFREGETSRTIPGLSQWDYGRKLEITHPDLPAVLEVHFAVVGTLEAIVRAVSGVNGTAVAVIPDELLRQARPILAWAYIVSETGGETILTVTMPVRARAKPAGAPTLPEDMSDKYTEALEAINVHAGRRDNPHGITAEQIGAAPAGFGLGEERSKEIYDANNIDLPGFYQSKANTPDESQYWFILHSKHHKNYSHKKQLAFSVQSGHICVRSCHTDWQPWEYVNPPMRVGVEYRTTERWMGKSVYTKLIDCGACPAVGDVKEIGHGVGSYSSIISFNGHLSSGDALPYINYRGTTGTANDIVSQVNLSVTPTNVKLATIKWGISSPEVTSLTATVQIKYTKG